VSQSLLDPITTPTDTALLFIEFPKRSLKFYFDEQREPE
jgi:hypothetical protein